MLHRLVYVRHMIFNIKQSDEMQGTHVSLSFVLASCRRRPATGAELHHASALLQKHGTRKTTTHRILQECVGHLSYSTVDGATPAASFLISCQRVSKYMETDLERGTGT